MGLYVEDTANIQCIYNIHLIYIIQSLLLNSKKLG